MQTRGLKIESFLNEVAALYIKAMRRDLRANVPDLSAYMLPQAVLAHEIKEGLYNSQRDYLEQIAAYKVFQGKVLAEG